MARKSLSRDRETLELARHAQLPVAGRTSSTVESPTRGKLWPMVSANAGCNPEQVAEANRRVKALGGLHGTRYKKNGDVVYPSQKAQTAHLKSIKHRNKSSYSH